MTDNEIVKALECCIGDCEGKNCFDCSLYEIDDCQQKLSENALDLINRQKAENKDLQDLMVKYNADLTKQEAEIERLQNILMCFMDALGKVRKVDDIEEISLIPLMSELNKQYRAELKAEAYKEFAERLKKEMKICLYGNYISQPLKRMAVEDINNLLKEMVGEDNVNTNE